MNAPKFTIAALAVAAAGMVGTAYAQADDIGKREFNASCAVCHGASGKGDGPMVGMLSGRIPDLSTLTRRSNGVFPFARIHDMIDGTGQMKGHGTREMPIWGTRYSEQATEQYRDFLGPFDTAAFARGRVLALTEYVYRLQAK